MTKRKQIYDNYLESEAWKLLRKQKFLQVGRICQNPKCRKSNPIHVHHIWYKNLTNCTTDDLIVFCEDCHNILHKMIRFKNMSLEGHELSVACALINEFKASPDYEIRKNKIRLKRKAFQERKAKEINLHHLAKREKKEISRAMNRMFSAGATMEELEKFIAIVQGVADRRNGIQIVIPADRSHVGTLIMEYSA